MGGGATRPAPSKPSKQGGSSPNLPSSPAPTLEFQGQTQRLCPCLAPKGRNLNSLGRQPQVDESMTPIQPRRGGRSAFESTCRPFGAPGDLRSRFPGAGAP